MKKVLGVVIALGLVLGAFSLSAANAEENNAQPAKKRLTAVAVAMGQLQEAGGESATVDLRAGARNGRAAGNLRFYSEDDGYYNGAVRRLVVENGTAKVEGGGVLVRPDGTRVRVRFSADFSEASRQVTIKVTGANAFEYTLSGTLDPGFVKARNIDDSNPVKPGNDAP